MLRAIGIFLVATCPLSQLHAGQMSEPREASWIAVTLIRPHNIQRRSIILVQDEPYCPSGAGPCGGTCSEESGKQWTCPRNAIPCYQSASRCSCQTAVQCLPKPRVP
jgi:hypothetical protein